MWVLVIQSCPSLCNPIDCILPGSSAYEFLWAGILELIALPFSYPRDWTLVSCTAGRFFTAWATRKKGKSLSHVRLFVTPWTIAHQAPQSMEFFRQEYWSGLPFPSPWATREALNYTCVILKRKIPVMNHSLCCEQQESLFCWSIRGLYVKEEKVGTWMNRAGGCGKGLPFIQHPSACIWRDDRWQI